MKINKVIANDGSQVNIADKIENVQFASVHNQEIDKKHFDLLKDLLLQLDSEKITGLQQEVREIEVQKDSNRLEKLKTKINIFLQEYGKPLVESLSASAIYDILKSLLV